MRITVDGQRPGTRVLAMGDGIAFALGGALVLFAGPLIL
jgi:hypothetical protein